MCGSVVWVGLIIIMGATSAESQSGARRSNGCSGEHEVMVD